MHRDDEPMDDVHALLRALDHPVPGVTAEEVAARARTAPRVAPSVRWAAAALLTLGAAGAAYALPGSPVPGWMGAIAAWLGAGSEAQGGASEDPRARSDAPPADHGSAGVAVLPGPSLIIDFSVAPPGALARVTLSEGAEVVVRAPAGAATFTSGTDRLVIEDTGRPDTFAVEIPRSAPLVELRAGGTRLFLKSGARVEIDGAPRLGDVYQIPLRRVAEQVPPSSP